MSFPADSCEDSLFVLALQLCSQRSDTGKVFILSPYSQGICRPTSQVFVPAPCPAHVTFLTTVPRSQSFPINYFVRRPLSPVPSGYSQTPNASPGTLDQRKPSWRACARWKQSYLPAAEEEKPPCRPFTSRIQIQLQAPKNASPRPVTIAPTSTAVTSTH